MLKLHPAPDQLYHQVADDRDHIGWRLPQKDTSDYGWGPGSYRVAYFATGRPQGPGRFQSESTGIANLAGRYAAAMALAHQIWKTDAAMKPYAERCLRAGVEVYRLGKAREGFQQGNSYGSPYRYNENTWADDMEWGAAELYRATGEKSYLADARRFAEIIGSTSWMGRETAAHYEFYPFMNLGHFALHSLVDGTFQKTLAGYYREGLESCRRKGSENPWQIGIPFIWCSNNLVVALATQGYLYEAMTRNSAYRAFTSAQVDWLFGRNPWGTSMFTGLPDKAVFRGIRTWSPPTSPAARSGAAWSTVPSPRPFSRASKASPFPGRTRSRNFNASRRSITTTWRTIRPMSQPWTALHPQSCCCHSSPPAAEQTLSPGERARRWDAACFAYPSYAQCIVEIEIRESCSLSL